MPSTHSNVLNTRIGGSSPISTRNVSPSLLKAVGQSVQVAPSGSIMRTASKPKAAVQQAPISRPAAMPLATAQAPVAAVVPPKTNPPTVNAQTATKPERKTSVTEPKATTYGGLIGGLETASRPSKEQSGLLSKLRAQTQANRDIASDAREISRKYSGEIEKLGRIGAGAQAGALSTGTNVVGSGNAAIASQSVSARQDALARGQQANLDATAQQLTGQAQSQAALTDSLNAANQQQQNRTTALTNAGDLLSPVQVSPGNTLFNPSTGGEVAGGLGGYANYNTAEKVMGLIGQYPDIGYTYDPSKTPQQNYQAVQNALRNSPSYQKETYGVPGQQSVAGATAVQTAQKGYEDATMALNDLVAQTERADAIGQNLVSIMSKNNINPADVRLISRPYNEILRQLSSADQAEFLTALEGAKGVYQSILASGGGQTNSQADGAFEDILNKNSSYDQVIKAINTLAKEAQYGVNSLAKKQANYYGNLGQGGSVSSEDEAWAGL